MPSTALDDATAAGLQANAAFACRFIENEIDGTRDQMKHLVTLWVHLPALRMQVGRRFRLAHADDALAVGSVDDPPTGC